MQADDTSHSCDDQSLPEGTSIESERSGAVPGAVAVAAAATANSSTTNKRSGRLSFPWQLHQMLSDADRSGFSHIVSWSLSGETFRVHDSAAFVERVLPKYFKQTKYKSFSRQLHIYGFKWISKGPEKGAYHHPKFIRNHVSMCLQIYREKVMKNPASSKEVLEDEDGKREKRLLPDGGDSYVHWDPTTHPSSSISSLGAVMPPPPARLPAPLTSTPQNASQHWMNGQARASLFTQNHTQDNRSLFDVTDMPRPAVTFASLDLPEGQVDGPYQNFKRDDEISLAQDDMKNFPNNMEQANGGEVPGLDNPGSFTQFERDTGFESTVGQPKDDLDDMEPRSIEDMVSNPSNFFSTKR